MTLKHLFKPREQTLGEEIANSISHGVGLVAALVLAPILIIFAFQKGNSHTVIAAGIFAATVILLYLASTLYHALPHKKAKKVLRIFDHSAIFLLIAGSYTPFTVGLLKGVWGWTLFGVVWGLAIVGIGLKIGFGTRYPKISTTLYLLMGWLVVFAIKPLWTQMPREGFYWLVAGGLAYTLGVFFFAAERIRYNHFIWHLFVLAGTTCHYVMILFYV
ncbi:MAG: hemolysin III family protein [Verrucomicrobiota bacterium]|nr:hemolysin III family protein [Verrucomicrobiota bacterium]